jgi:hypothetical protein
MLSRLTAMPSLSAKRAPARPASASPIASNVAFSSPVRRARGVVSPRTCSANVRVVQSALSQKNRRTRSTTSTGRPLIGASAR